VNEHRYHINLFRSDEDGCWIADVPDLRYCSAYGASPAEALAQVREAMIGWFEVARERGCTISDPRYRPAIDPASPP
jgi:predicted RNase H-like HicB family nuclease